MTEQAALAKPEVVRPKALISVYSKAGIAAFARGLVGLGWDIISSGGTATHLKTEGVPVTDVAEITGMGPVLDHRVVTLGAQVHGGLLAADQHLEELKQLGWPKLDLVCVDMYPLRQAVENPDATRESVIKDTDIGGPTMLRSAAKGRRIVICDPADRERVLTWLKNGSPDKEAFITELCAKAEGVVSAYCLMSARYHSQGAIDGVVGTQVVKARYGENPSWSAALYASDDRDPLALHRFKQEAGADPSFINLTDLDRVLRTMVQVTAGFIVNGGQAPYIALAVKHGNCCGAAVASDAVQAVKKLVQCDPLSIFGGVVMTNFPINELVAQTLRRHLMDGGDKRLLDAVIAPSFSEEAHAVLERKQGKCRLLSNPKLADIGLDDLPSSQMRPVRGSFLLQHGPPFVLKLDDERMERTDETTASQGRDLVLAWSVGSTSVSNTITLVKDGMLIGNGVGQQARVRAAELAVSNARKNGHDPAGAVGYSDSFFPHPDGALVLAEAGISFIFASSGSLQDEVVRQALVNRKVTFWQLPDKVCRGFFHH